MGVAETAAATISLPTPSHAVATTKGQIAIQTIASFFPYMNSWGVLNSFGVFEAYYAQHLIPSSSSSHLAWIGSMQAFLLFLVGVLMGPLLDAGYHREVLIGGTLLISFGMMMTSLCTKYWQLMLAQGIVVGLGYGFTFIPSIAILPQYVSAKSRGPLLGIVTTGSSVGGIVFPIMFHYIVPSAGFGWATRAIGFVVLGTNLPAALTLKNKIPPPPGRRQLIDFPMLKEKPYLVLICPYFFAVAALYIPIFFLQSYAQTTTDISRDLAQWTIPIVNAGSLPGRIIPNMLGAKFGELNAMVVVTACCSILAFCWIAVKSSTTGIILFALLYGFFSGGFVSLFPPVTITTAPNMSKLGTRMGMTMTMLACGVFLGSPVGGAILEESNSYLGAQLFTGAMLAVSVGLLLMRRILFTVKQ